MLQAAEIEKFDRVLKRIFSLNISRSTFREIQNAAVAATGGNRDAAQHLFESLVRGESQQGELDDIAFTALQELVQEYSIPVKLSKDVSEKGEFINLITSDTLRHGELFAFLNRIRRIDGDEFQFITDLDSTLHVLLHFGSRLQELRSVEGGTQLLASKTESLVVIRNQINALINAGTQTQEASSDEEV